MENSNINWTDHTWNPWIGCRHVSAECDHCYADTIGDESHGQGLFYVQRTKTWKAAKMEPQSPGSRRRWATESGCSAHHSPTSLSRMPTSGGTRRGMSSAGARRWTGSS